MSYLLNRLWSVIWEEEERKKAVWYEKEIEGATERARKTRSLLTDLQKMALKHGAERPSVNDQAYYNHQLGIQHMMMQAQQNQMAAGQGGAAGGSLSGSGGGLAGYASGGLGGGGATTSTVLGTPGHVLYGLGNTPRKAKDVLFDLLRGVEELSHTYKDTRHNYDDDGFSLLDTRNFDSGEVDIGCLASFCLSNAVEVEPFVIILERHGVKVV